LTKQQLVSSRELSDLLSAVREAGEVCLRIREAKRIRHEIKSDMSPVTEADFAANRIIESCLNSLEFRAPVYSEESSTSQPCHDSTFWLVDPLDGTKEFISGSSDFTQNVCLIIDGNPVLGVVYAPAHDYMAWTAGDGFRTSGAIEFASVARGSNSESDVVVVASKSHLDEETGAFLDKYPTARTVQMGSSLKILLLAAGLADVYPRFAPTMPWDLGAADACLRSVGGGLFDSRGELLDYSNPLKKNPAFVGISERMMEMRDELFSAMRDAIA